MKPTRCFAPLAGGQLHYVDAGPRHAAALLLLHQTPRSWREYAGVIPHLAAHWRVIAMDTPGFGDSEAGHVAPTIAAWATAARQLLDHLGLEQVHAVGHHTGGVVAVELAAVQPRRVASLVLSSTPITDAAFRQARAGSPAIDEVEPQADGSHLQALWARRQPFYPADRPDLLEAFVADALKVGYSVEQGHLAVAQYRMEDRLGGIVQPMCIFQALQDPFASRHADHWHRLFPEAATVVFPQGGVPLPDQLPQDFARAVHGFVQVVEAGGAPGRLDGAADPG